VVEQETELEWAQKSKIVRLGKNTHRHWPNETVVVVIMRSSCHDFYPSQEGLDDRTTRRNNQHLPPNEKLTAKKRTLWISLVLKVLAPEHCQ
jgi:hypothetical protein